jgi:hypothetical protein
MRQPLPSDWISRSHINETQIATYSLPVPFYITRIGNGVARVTAFHRGEMPGAWRQEISIPYGGREGEFRRWLCLNTRLMQDIMRESSPFEIAEMVCLICGHHPGRIGEFLRPLLDRCSIDVWGEMTNLEQDRFLDGAGIQGDGVGWSHFVVNLLAGNDPRPNRGGE